ncbi:MAG: arginase family protein, partial [Rikenellaceae bacterium]|nr:arginase family protein [Rikenellaceae bacterium]
MDKLFDPNGVGVANGNYYGLPFSEAEADLVLVEAPWDVTVSYGDGTADGPEAIREASTQLDLYDADYRDAWRRGIAAT